MSRPETDELGSPAKSKRVPFLQDSPASNLAVY